ncbi:hypothetical protein ERJ75_000006600 [Trypanosoma vivax]|nr:hypothetical protein ERJ75_000006600 [Trypanosoma vivax]
MGRVLDAAFSDCGSRAVLRVAHPCYVPGDAVTARARTCALDRVRRVSRRCIAGVAAGATEEDMETAPLGASECVEAPLVIGTPTADAVVSRVSVLASRCAALTDELRAAEDALGESARGLVVELERRVAEASAEEEALTESVRALSRQAAETQSASWMLRVSAER